MIGNYIGRAIGCPGARTQVVDATGVSAGVATVTGLGNSLFSGVGSSAGTSTVLGVGDAVGVQFRTITDTVTYLQNPVDFFLAGEGEEKRRQRSRGQMTRTTMKNIFRE